MGFQAAFSVLAAPKLCFQTTFRVSGCFCPLSRLRGRAGVGAVAARIIFAARQPSGSANRHPLPDPPPRRVQGREFVCRRSCLCRVCGAATHAVCRCSDGHGTVRAWYPRAWLRHTPYAAWLGRLKGFSDGLFGFNFVEAALSGCFAPYPACGGTGVGRLRLGQSLRREPALHYGIQDSRLRGNDGIVFFGRPFGFSGCQTAADSTTKGRPL